ncbi:MAG TPA: NAD(P)-binding domain-containing protein [Ignavibacteria bacterium]|nr:NAD(P)-binding domain-containing protein [Ignavibacteria bacterium]
MKLKSGNIGIIGSGIVAKTLANGFIKHGYNVMVGSRNESKLAEWKSEAGKKGKTGSMEQSAAFGDIIVLAVKGTGAKEALTLAGKENLKGKTIIDTTNPIADTPPVNGVIRFFTTIDKSLMEMLQDDLPEANFVKAFNIIGNPFMVNPDFHGQKPTMFICGNNDEAKKEISVILELFGHEVEDMGKAEAAGTIEQLCILWCIPGFLRNQWTHAFKLLKA